MTRALWLRYWPGEWPKILDAFRAEVGDNGARMWEMAEALCRNEDEMEVIRHAIERVCFHVPYDAYLASRRRIKREADEARIGVAEREAAVRGPRVKRTRQFVIPTPPCALPPRLCVPRVTPPTLDDYDRRSYREHWKPAREPMMPERNSMRDSPRMLGLLATNWPTQQETREALASVRW